MEEYDYCSERECISIPNVCNLEDIEVRHCLVTDDTDFAKTLRNERRAKSIAEESMTKAFMDEYQGVPHEFEEPVSVTNLPMDLMKNIVGKLTRINSYFHGATAVARDLCMVASMSREWRIVAKHGFEIMAHRFDRYRHSIDWNHFIQYPSNFKRRKLRHLAFSCGLCTNGSKGTIAIRILNSLNIKVACRPSVQPIVLHTLAKERRMRLLKINRTLTDAGKGKLGENWRVVMKNFRWTCDSDALVNWSNVKMYLSKEFGTLEIFNQKADLEYLKYDHERMIRERFIEAAEMTHTIEEAKHFWMKMSHDRSIDDRTVFRSVMDKERTIKSTEEEQQIITQKFQSIHEKGIVEVKFLADTEVKRLIVPEKVFVMPTLEEATLRWNQSRKEGIELNEMFRTSRYGNLRYEYK